MDGERLAALIGAYEPGPGGVRALTPLAGLTLVEHQARRAVTAGAERVLLLVDEVPAALSAALGRLRQEGIAIGLAEGIDAAADALADARVLLIADACLADEELLARVAAAAVPALATLPDAPEHERYERIDGEVRWAGVALLDGHRVAETAAMLGSWDPVSTLLRRAVQDGAERVACDVPPLLLVDDASVAVAAHGIVAAARRPAASWPEHFLFAPAEELALPFLLRRPITATPLAVAGAASALLAAASAGFGWRWPALVLLLGSGPIAAIAARLGRVQSRPPRHAPWLERARIAGAGMATLGLAGTLVRASGQWGWWLVAATIVAAMLALGPLARLIGRPRPLWIASVDGLVWALLPLALFGRWGAGMSLVAGYAAVSDAWLLRQADQPVRA